MLYAVQRLLQRVRLTLTGDVLAAFQQLFGEFQLLAVPGFQFVKFSDKVLLFLLNGGQAFAVALIADCDIFQQRLLLYVQRGHQRANTGQRLRHGVEAHAHAGAGRIE